MLAFNGVLHSTRFGLISLHRSNKTLYSPVSLRPLPSSFTLSLMELPSTQPHQGTEEEEEEEEEEGGEKYVRGVSIFLTVAIYFVR